MGLIESAEESEAVASSVDNTAGEAFAACLLDADVQLQAAW